MDRHTVVVYQYVHVRIQWQWNRSLRSERYPPVEINDILLQSLQYVVFRCQSVDVSHMRDEVYFQIIRQTHRRSVESRMLSTRNETWYAGTRPCVLPGDYGMLNQIFLLGQSRHGIARDGDEELSHQRVAGEEYATRLLISPLHRHETESGLDHVHSLQVVICRCIKSLPRPAYITARGILP